MLKMKKIFVAAVLVCTVLGVVACGGKTKEDQTKDTTNGIINEVTTTNKSNTTTTTYDEKNTDKTKQNTTRSTGIIDEIGDDVERGIRDIADDVKR